MSNPPQKEGGLGDLEYHRRGDYATQQGRGRWKGLEWPPSLRNNNSLFVTKKTNEVRLMAPVKLRHPHFFFPQNDLLCYSIHMTAEVGIQTT